MEKIRNLCFVVIGMMALMANSCEKDTDPAFPIQFELKLLDSTGRSVNTFKEGDTITFSLELNNTTNEDISIWNFVHELFSTTDFLVIYKQSDSGSWANLGRICTSNFFVEDIGYFGIKALGIKKFQLKSPISNADCKSGNAFLKPGKYRTGINYTFELGSGGKYSNQKKTVNASYYFTIL